MKNCFFIFCSILFCNCIHSQTISQIDSVSVEMCESLSFLNEEKDDVKVRIVFEKHIPVFYKNAKITSQSVADSLSQRIYYRLQKNCKTFRDILTRLEENKSDWVVLNEKPKSKVPVKACSDFFKGADYYYKEYDGKIVNVVITPTSWTETFEDNTSSKLKFLPNSNGEFALEFIESNNETRKNFSIKGDVYYYGLYALNNGVFDVWTLSKGDNVLYSFKLYPKKGLAKVSK